MNQPHGLRIQPLVFVGEGFISGEQEADSRRLLDAAAPRITRIDALLDFPHTALRAQVSTCEHPWRSVREADVVLGLHGAGESQMAVAKLADTRIPVVLYHEEYNPTHFLCGGAGTLAPSLSKVALTAQEVRDFLRSEWVIAALRSTRVVLLGGVSPSVPDSCNAPEKLASVFGMEFELAPIRVLLPADGNLAVRLAARIQRESEGIVGIYPEDILRAAELAVALRKAASDAKADAAAVDCMALFRAGGVAPCLALRELEDAGIPAACEGDLGSLVAKLILTYASGNPTFIGNLGEFDETAGTITLWHHTLPKAMMAGGEYGLRSYGGRGVHYAADLPVGREVTILKIGRNLDRAVVAEGTVAASGAKESGCVRFSVRVADIHRFMDNLLGNHHVVTFGHCADIIARALGRLGIRVSIV